MNSAEKPIPYNRPLFLERGLAHVRAAYEGGHVSGDGPFTRRCEAALGAVCGGNRALLTSSCTDALELGALLLGLGSGDEVILPAFTFVSTANAFVLRGARPVFADIRVDTANLDERQWEKLVTPRTKAVVAMHYAGVACEMDAIAAAAAKRGLDLVEDNAHGLFGTYRGRPLGSFGRWSALSFHETKNLSCGEGGAIVINDPSLLARAEILREKGTDRRRFFRGEISKYTWLDVGSSYLASDAAAALLWAQIEVRDAIQARRREIYQRYAAGLASWSRSTGVALPTVPAGCQPAYHLFHLFLPDRKARSALLAHLHQRAIHAVFHYEPLHLTPMGRRLGGQLGQCPVAESVSERIARLPFYHDLSSADQDRVIEGVLSFAP